jgi:hypothetical protein
MIGRLGLELGDCYNCFLRLSHSVFGHPTPWYMAWGGILAPRYSHLRMEAEINSVISSAGLPRNALLQAAAAGHPPQQMHTYVVCRRVNQNGELEPSHAALSTGEHTIPHCEVWKAGRATSAAPTYFLPQDIQTTSYVDGGLGFNNPIQTLSDEYNYLGFEEIHRKRIYYVSIGTGKPSNDELKRSRQYWRLRRRSFLLWVINASLIVLPRRAPGAQLARILNDQEAWEALLGRSVEENTHLLFQCQIAAEDGTYPHTTRYFRLNCDKDWETLDDGRGLSDIALDGYMDLERIENVTNMYLQRWPDEIDECMQELQAHIRTI